MSKKSKDSNVANKPIDAAEIDNLHNMLIHPLVRGLIIQIVSNYINQQQYQYNFRDHRNAHIDMPIYPIDEHGNRIRIRRDGNKATSL